MPLLEKYPALRLKVISYEEKPILCEGKSLKSQPVGGVQGSEYSRIPVFKNKVLWLREGEGWEYSSLFKGETHDTRVKKKKGRLWHY
ncbi:hypothetical protein BGZ93_001727 [Podila epicladia]|nr:hypothetical protein BGZ93_001727 [Podila epicladia]